MFYQTPAPPPDNNVITTNHVIIKKYESPMYFVDEDGMPTRLYINNETWTVKVVDTLSDGKKVRSDLMAQTDCDTHTILHKRIIPLSVEKEAMIHEIFHAGACDHGAQWWNSKDDTDEGHNGVYRLGSFLSSFMQSNPEFILWMVNKTQ